MRVSAHASLPVVFTSVTFALGNFLGDVLLHLEEFADLFGAEYRGKLIDILQLDGLRLLLTLYMALRSCQHFFVALFLTSLRLLTVLLGLRSAIAFS